nr:MAG TPA: hypothetical protein [Caudoviricetes sp.]
MITHRSYLKQYKNNQKKMRSSCNLMIRVYNVGR